MTLTLTPDQWAALQEVCREYQGRYPNTPKGREIKKLTEQIGAMALAISSQLKKTPA